MANLEHGVPITPASIFHIASISKQFTALCIAMLHLEGALSLDDDICRFVPEIPDYGQTITIRHLVHHTSGLRDQWDLLALAGWRADDPITEGDVLEIAARQTALNFPPGEQHLYSNTGYTLLAVIVHRASGQTLRRFADERIFRPLDMTRTHVHDDHSEIVPGRTQAYETRVGGGLKISIPVFDLGGTTSLFTTVEDLTRWSENFVHKRAGGPEAYALTLIPGLLNSGDATNYAFGLRLRTRRDGVKIIEHGGADAGYRAHFLLAPDERLAVICLANVPSVMPGVRAEQVLDHLLGGDVPSVPAPVAVPDGALAALAGVYRNDRTGDGIRFTVQDGTLTLAMYGGTPMSARSPREFIMPYAPTSVFAFDPESDRLEVRATDGTIERYARMPIVSLTTAELDAFAGIYTSDELGTIWKIVVADDGLKLQRRKFDDAPLAPAWSDAFFTDTFCIEFTRDAAGAVDGFGANTHRARGVRFVRR
jgi:CubicO group peptidase (beta-lactamase class C family)